MSLLIGSKPCAKTGDTVEAFDLVSVKSKSVITGYGDSSGKNCPSGKNCCVLEEVQLKGVSVGNRGCGVRKRNNWAMICLASWTSG